MLLKKCYLLFLAISCAQALRINLSGENCVFPFGSQRNWDTFWPVVFNQQGDLLPTSSVNDVLSVDVPYGESVIVSCGPNYIKERVPQEYVLAKCHADGKFIIDGSEELKRPKNLACDLRSVQEILAEVNGCPVNNVGIKYGLVNPVDHKAYITGEACYNHDGGQTFFAHIRKGVDLASSVIEIIKKDIFKKPAPPSRYKVDFMKAFRLDEFNERLRDLLNIKVIPGFHMVNFVDDHFLPNSQLYSTKKLAWNYLVVHDTLVNFDLLKEDIGNLNGTVDIHTGTHGVSSLKNKEGKRIPIYLDEDRFPVPEIIWFVVKHDNMAIAIAIFNDPFMTESEIKEKSFCNNKCGSVNWLNRLNTNQQYANKSDGYVLCCDLNDFKNAVPEFSRV